LFVGADVFGGIAGAGSKALNFPVLLRTVATGVNDSHV
jgi:hypothetical protein